MTNDELKDLIADLVTDEEILDQIIVLEGDEFADGAIGLTDDYHLVYDYNKLVKSLSEHNKWSEEEAIEWLDYNTLRAISYMESAGNVPIIITNTFADYLPAAPEQTN